MSTPSNRRPRPRAETTTTDRRRREPLFPLEDADIAPRRLPPQPLADILDDTPGLSERQARSDRRTASFGASPRRDDPVAQPAAPAGHPAAESPTRTRPPVTPRNPGAASSRTSGASRQLTESAAKLYRARTGLDEAEADLLRADLIGRPYSGYQRQAASGGVPLPQLLAVVGLSILILLFFGGGRLPDLSRWSLPAPVFSVAEAPVQQLAGPTNPVGDYRLQGPPSLTPDQIDQILAGYGSPATGTGAIWYELGVQRGIDPAFAVAFFIHESSAGTARNWAGLKPDGSSTHNVGNIICAGYATCYNRFRDYASWEVGIADWYRLIDVEYIQGRGTLTLQEIIPIYAPSFENDVGGYVNTVARLVDSWRRGEVR
ncbi:MAG: glucosaminidase domain-containing protein [Oscillochloris sp.]|nr:glucosaminidase domain-containing protein [Oscillochloris sp.]